MGLVVMGGSIQSTITLFLRSQILTFVTSCDRLRLLLEESEHLCTGFRVPNI